MNRYDALAPALFDAFTTHPDETPFNALPRTVPGSKNPPGAAGASYSLVGLPRAGPQRQSRGPARAGAHGCAPPGSRIAAECARGLPPSAPPMTTTGASGRSRRRDGNALSLLGRPPGHSRRSPAAACRARSSMRSVDPDEAQAKRAREVKKMVSTTLPRRLGLSRSRRSLSRLLLGLSRRSRRRLADRRQGRGRRRHGEAPGIDRTWLYVDDARVAGAVHPRIAMSSVAYTSVGNSPSPSSTRFPRVRRPVQHVQLVGGEHRNARRTWWRRAASSGS